MKQIRRKTINKKYINFKKKPYKSIKIKEISFENQESKVKNIIKIFSLLFIIFVSIFIVSIIYKKYNKNDLSNNQENQEFFNNLLSKINTEEKYRGAKFCYNNNDDSCIYKYFCPKKVVGKNLKIYGLSRDGGYILTEDLKNIKIAYSFGVDSEYSFDMHMADNDIDVYMYDPFIKGLDFLQYNLNNGQDFKNNADYYQKKFHFFKIGLTGSKKQDNMKTLQEILNDNGHLNEKDMILKMDVEGSEWDSLNELSEDILKKFKYITLELHFGNNTSELEINVLKKLSKFHQVIFIRFNNAGELIEFGYNKICTLIEISYMLKKGNKFIRDPLVYPLKEMNFKNVIGKPEIDYDLNIYKLFYEK